LTTPLTGREPTSASLPSGVERPDADPRVRTSEHLGEEDERFRRGLGPEHGPSAGVDGGGGCSDARAALASNVAPPAGPSRGQRGAGPMSADGSMAGAPFVGEHRDQALAGEVALASGSAAGTQRTGLPVRWIAMGVIRRDAQARSAFGASVRRARHAPHPVDGLCRGEARPRGVRLPTPVGVSEHRGVRRPWVSRGARERGPRRGRWRASRRTNLNG
jgi:hypothetical protein